MIDDPQRGRSTALSIGIALVCVCVAGSAVLAFFKPAKKVGDEQIVAEKDTGALYVRVGSRLHPALNLTSARLIVGTPANPVEVAQDELATVPRGGWVGIPGAPGGIKDSGSRDSAWTVCDTAKTGASAPVNPQTGLPTVSLSAVQSTVIGGPLQVDNDASRPLANNEARLLRDDTTTWLVYRDGEQGVVRAAIDLADSAVTLALGIDATAPVVSASKGLLNALPEAPPVRVPNVPGSGESTRLGSLNSRVGSILTVPTPDRGISYYLVSQSGVVRVTEVLASMIRNADSQGAASTRAVGPDVIAANLRPGAWPGTATYPTGPVRIVDPRRSEVTCYHWSRGGSDPRAATELLVGRQLPLPSEEQNRTVWLVTSSGSNGTTANAAYMPRDTGRFVQVTGGEPGSTLREALYWISDSGVRYGIDVDSSKAANGPDPTITALGLRNPVPAPWSIVSLFAVGPTLSQREAKIQHDGIPADKNVAVIGGTS